MSLFASILIVEDEENTREGLVQYLEAQNYDVLEAKDGNEGWEMFEEHNPDIVLSDIRMPTMDGISLLDKMKHHRPDAKVILLTAYGSVEDAVKAMKKGAFYYLTKPVNLEELDFQIKKALASQHLEQENKELKKALFNAKFEQGNIVAESPAMKEVLGTVEKIATSDASVLIEGESGTGKELIAHRIHDLSERRSQPFVAVHCAALTETLLTSELFGHEKGAFTGANERKIGRFERAHEGTLFLDEIGEISKETQVKLLRVLQDGTFERVGGTKTIKTNVRLICATNKNLMDEVKAGNFREDLYYRINVIYLKVPSIRERREDIPPLVRDFIKLFSVKNQKKITDIYDNAMEALSNYSWPGNVREIKNIVERMVVLANSDKLDLTSIPRDLLSESNNMAAPIGESSSSAATISDMEKNMIEQALRDVHGNKSMAAKKLGISRRTLYRKIEEYKINA